MKQRRFTVTISEECDATTAEHAAREIAYRLIRWDADKYGPLKLTVIDEFGDAVVLTTDDYAPRFVWDDETGASGVA